MRKTTWILSALTAVALSTATHGAETKIDGAAIVAALANHVFEGIDGGRKTEQIFHKDGVTYYSVDGSQSQGRWEVRGDQYCSQWPPNESWSCYDVFADGSMLIFQSASGTRYPVEKVN